MTREKVLKGKDLSFYPRAGENTIVRYDSYELSVAPDIARELMTVEGLDFSQALALEGIKTNKSNNIPLVLAVVAIGASLL